jgi:hypothetical protein
MLADPVRISFACLLPELHRFDAVCHSANIAAKSRHPWVLGGPVSSIEVWRPAYQVAKLPELFTLGEQAQFA